MLSTDNRRISIFNSKLLIYLFKKIIMAPTSQILIVDSSVSKLDVEKESASNQTEVVQLENVKSFTGPPSSEVVLMVGDGQNLVANYLVLSDIADKIIQPGGKLRIKFLTELSSETRDILVRKLKYGGYIGVVMDGNSIVGGTQKQVIY